MSTRSCPAPRSKLAWLSIALACALVGLVLSVGPRPVATASAATAPRVTLIGDSVPSSLDYVPAARAILAAGIDLQLQLAPCRRVGQASCPYLGSRPPTVVDLVPTLGSALGPTVVVAVGYNDFVAAYAGDLEDALTALHKVGVTRVLWVTLHEQRPDYATMNLAIQAAATRHPELTVVDWQAYSRSRPDWFQPDGIHLTAAGAIAMATLIHNALVALGIPLPVQAPPGPLGIAIARLPDATVGRPYSADLAARGGRPPLHWRRTAGRLAQGLRLLPDGRVRGVPLAAGSFSLLVRVTDGRGAFATRRIRLLVRPRTS